MNGAKFKFFFIFENVLPFPGGLENTVKYLETCLSNSSLLIMIAVLEVYKQSAVSNWNLVCIFNVVNESPGKMRKNIKYLWHYSTNFSKIFIKMTSICLTILVIVIDDLGNLGQCQNLQNSFILKLVYFYITFQRRISRTVTGNHKIPRVSDFSDSVEIGHWHLFYLPKIVFREEWKTKRDYSTYSVMFYGQMTFKNKLY